MALAWLALLGTEPATAASGTVVLLGDGVLDNRRDVVARPRAAAPDWIVDDRAVDGGRNRDIPRQATAAADPEPPADRRA